MTARRFAYKSFAALICVIRRCATVYTYGECSKNSRHQLTKRRVHMVLASDRPSE